MYSFAVQVDIAFIWDQRASQRFDQRGLTGPIVADHREDFAGKQREIGAVQGDYMAEVLDDPPASRTGFGSKVLMFAPGARTGHGHGKNHKDAGDEHLIHGGDSHQLQTVAEDADDQCADQGPEDCASPAKQTRAAKHDGGDAIQVRRLSCLRIADLVRATRSRPAIP